MIPRAIVGLLLLFAALLVPGGVLAALAGNWPVAFWHGIIFAVLFAAAICYSALIISSEISQQEEEHDRS